MHMTISTEPYLLYNQPTTDKQVIDTIRE